MSTRFLERLLALAGALASLGISVGFWRALSDQQPMWPIPSLYLIEIVALSIVAMLFAWRDESFAGTVVSAVVGVLFAFVILGVFTIGPLLLPSVLVFAIAAILAERRQRRSILIGLAVCLAAGVVQSAVMLAIIQLL